MYLGRRMSALGVALGIFVFHTQDGGVGSSTVEASELPYCADCGDRAKAHQQTASRREFAGRAAYVPASPYPADTAFRPDIEPTMGPGGHSGAIAAHGGSGDRLYGSPLLAEGTGSAPGSQPGNTPPKDGGGGNEPGHGGGSDNGGGTGGGGSTDGGTGDGTGGGDPPVVPDWPPSTPTDPSTPGDGTNANPPALSDVPEPGSILIVAAGLIGAFRLRRRQRLGIG